MRAFADQHSFRINLQFGRVALSLLRIRQDGSVDEIKKCLGPTLITDTTGYGIIDDAPWRHTLHHHCHNSGIGIGTHEPSSLSFDDGVVPAIGQHLLYSGDTGGKSRSGGRDCEGAEE